jgi:uncharacterized protein (UPF0264 family)
MSELLVSVRSVAEARAALAGGAALIDVKEPDHGSLGRPCITVARAVQQAVAGRCPVSVALGELHETTAPLAVAGLHYAKWGLSSCINTDWESRLLQAGAEVSQTVPGCQLVAVAYADWKRANSPAPQAVCDFACSHRWKVFLIDTWLKDGTVLLDWLSRVDIEELVRRCRSAGVRIALAGSLGMQEIRALQPVQPDWFAVRGAACRAGSRRGEVEENAVRRLVSLLAEPVPDAMFGG